MAIIRVCGQTIELHNIAPLSTIRAKYRIRTDSEFDISITFADNRHLFQKSGYVTNGFNFYHEIVIDNTNIYITFVGHDIP